MAVMLRVASGDAGRGSWCWMAGDRLRRVLAVLAAGGDGWSSVRLCGACPQIVGVSGARGDAHVG
jgi:hypothetical protein